MRKKYVIWLVLLALGLFGCSKNPQVPASPEDIPEPYLKVLSDYRAIIDFRLSSYFEESHNNGESPKISEELTRCINDGLEYEFSCMLAEMTFCMDHPSRESFGYFLQDVNHDGTAELFWVREDYFILAVFSIQDNRAKLIDALWPRHRMVVTDEGFLYTRSSGGADYTEFEMRRIEGNGELSTIFAFGIEGKSYYEITDGKKENISQARFEELLRLYPFEDGAH